jgi:hypothetical protein
MRKFYEAREYELLHAWKKKKKHWPAPLTHPKLTKAVSVVTDLCSEGVCRSIADLLSLYVGPAKHRLFQLRLFDACPLMLHVLGPAVCFEHLNRCSVGSWICGIICQ